MGFQKRDFTLTSGVRMNVFIIGKINKVTVWDDMNWVTSSIRRTFCPECGHCDWRDSYCRSTPPIVLTPRRHQPSYVFFISGTYYTTQCDAYKSASQKVVWFLPISESESSKPTTQPRGAHVDGSKMKGGRSLCIVYMCACVHTHTHIVREWQKGRKRVTKWRST